MHNIIHWATPETHTTQHKSKHQQIHQIISLHQVSISIFKVSFIFFSYSSYHMTQPYLFLGLSLGTDHLVHFYSSIAVGPSLFISGLFFRQSSVPFFCVFVLVSVVFKYTFLPFFFFFFFFLYIFFSHLILEYLLFGTSSWRLFLISPFFIPFYTLLQVSCFSFLCLLLGTMDFFSFLVFSLYIPIPLSSVFLSLSRVPPYFFSLFLFIFGVIFFSGGSFFCHS